MFQVTMWMCALLNGVCIKDTTVLHSKWFEQTDDVPRIAQCYAACQRGATRLTDGVVQYSCSVEKVR